MGKGPRPKHEVMAWIGTKPVYADRVRPLTDVAAAYHPDAWKPANTPAQKLFRCVECLRDLDVLLQAAGRSKAKVKRRRNLKILHTPLYSLVEAIKTLANDLENNPDTIRRLPFGGRKLIVSVRGTGTGAKGVRSDLMRGDEQKASPLDRLARSLCRRNGTSPMHRD